MALQVGTNFANDYSDGIRGTDGETRVGPPRLVGDGLATPGEVKRAAFASFGLAAVVGLALSIAVGPELLVVGAASIAAGWFYTGGPRPYGYAGFGEVFVFVFFGLVATIGSAYIHTETIRSLDILAGVAVGFPVTALLIINNLRDIPGDTESGKRTLAVRLGDPATRNFYTAVLLGGYALLIPLAVQRPAAAIAFATLPFAFQALKMVRDGAVGRELIAVLGATGRVELLHGLALALGLAISA